jgi:hypothetical protein
MSTRVQIPVRQPVSPARSFTPTPAGMLQRQCTCGGSGSSDGECEACSKKKLQRRTAGRAPELAPPIVHEVLRSPGHPLDVASRAYFEPRFGHDFSKVRVHSDARAAESARSVNSLAYTVAQDIAFGEGQFTPHTTAGRRLLAHELAHTVQQGGDAPPAPSLRIEEPGSVVEREANEAAERIGEGTPYSPKLSQGQTLARQGPAPVPGPGFPPSPPPPPAPSGPIISASEEWGPETRRSCDNIFRWRVRWNTTGRDGFIVQEINRARHMFPCTKGKKRTGSEVTLSGDPPGHFWEVWRVEADGSMSPSNEDSWILTALPDTEGDWNISGKAFWTHTLDPAAGFAIQKWDPGQLATLKQPKGLGSVLLSREKHGTWNCCEDKAT